MARMVQDNPDGYVDLWARGHGKSLIVTYALTIQDLLKDVELTFGIFSFNNNIAVQFLRQIKSEFEVNDVLKDLFDDILWQDPKKEAPKWTENDGILLKRKGNPKELTIEAYGLVDNQPTSKHFKKLIFDDVIEITAARSPVLMQKAYDAFEMAQHLGTHDVSRRIIGTRYKVGDPYQRITEQGLFQARIIEATEDGTRNGKPVYLTEEEIEEKRKMLSVYNFSCQMLQSPVADAAKSFNPDWLRYYEDIGNWKYYNRYLLVDPATTKKKTSDYTAMLVIGYGRDDNYYVLDIVRDRLGLHERVHKVLEMVDKWNIKTVGYEQYGLQSDIEYLDKELRGAGYHGVNVIKLAGRMAKEDRIEKLMPLFAENRIFLPEKLRYTDWEGDTRDLTHEFVHHEYLAFPNSTHDDVLDCMARMVDEDLGVRKPHFNPLFKANSRKSKRSGLTFMSA